MEGVINSVEDIKKIVRLYESGLTVEDISDEIKIRKNEVYRVVYNYRFSFKAPDQFQDLELWKLATTPIRIV